MTVYLSLGSNMGERIDFLSAAIKRIGEIEGVKVVNCSSVYDTPPWGYSEQATFYNCVLAIQTDLEAEVLLQKLLAIEKDLGRERLFKYGPRVIDIDILLYGDEIHDSETLSVPHPFMYERAFVLVPLREIAPEHVPLDSPGLNDTSGIVKVSEPLQ
ncbi:2-amino-4-hydroxy-6-hydroxymethyldihydropteridine diphosphokinase [Brochothrix thermosphacta]|nr:2-amino-4-hydroxy-6-hydroxymethyldihydropteridine diphosphokinase [Brochothrix thermosphacta]